MLSISLCRPAVVQQIQLQSASTDCVDATQQPHFFRVEGQSWSDWTGCCDVEDLWPLNPKVFAPCVRPDAWCSTLRGERTLVFALLGCAFAGSCVCKHSEGLETLVAGKVGIFLVCSQGSFGSPADLKVQCNPSI